MQRELLRSQKINREIMVDAQKLGTVADKDTKPFKGLPDQKAPNFKLRKDFFTQPISPQRSRTQNHTTVQNER